MRPGLFANSQKIPRNINMLLSCLYPQNYPRIDAEFQRPAANASDHARFSPPRLTTPQLKRPIACVVQRDKENCDGTTLRANL